MSERALAAFSAHRAAVDESAARLAAPLERVAERIASALRAEGKVLVLGNGGSAADAQHLAAELVGRFRRDRRGLAAIALTTDTSALTAIANDFGFDEVFARQVEALARPGDVVIAISTSGRSENACRALEAARARGAETVALTGGTGGRLAALADHALIVPASETARIQEVHILAIHVLCDIVDEAFAEPPLG